MVLTAAAANNFTATAISVHTTDDLQQEIDLLERAIRGAANRRVYRLVYDARIIGNPSGDPQTDATLTAAQIAFRDALIAAGYLVTIDSATGFWGLSWEALGVTNMVSVYSIKTTVTPGAVYAATVSAVDLYLSGLIPVVRSTTKLATPNDVDETDFGATPTAYYEYLVVVQQQDVDADHSTGIRTTLVNSGLGYVDAPSNVFVYRVV